MTAITNTGAVTRDESGNTICPRSGFKVYPHELIKDSYTGDLVLKRSIDTEDNIIPEKTIEPVFRCTDYEIEDGKFESKGCYSFEDYTNLVSFISRYRSAEFTKEGAESTIISKRNVPTSSVTIEYGFFNKTAPIHYTYP